MPLDGMAFPLALHLNQIVPTAFFARSEGKQKRAGGGPARLVRERRVVFFAQYRLRTGTRPRKQGACSALASADIFEVERRDRQQEGHTAHKGDPSQVGDGVGAGS